MERRRRDTDISKTGDNREEMGKVKVIWGN